MYLLQGKNVLTQITFIVDTLQLNLNNLFQIQQQQPFQLHLTLGIHPLQLLKSIKEILHLHLLPRGHHSIKETHLLLYYHQGSNNYDLQLDFALLANQKEYLLEYIYMLVCSLLISLEFMFHICCLLACIN